MAQHTLADLTRISGAKRRSVQLWAEGGVLKADPTTERAGTGTHRTFGRDEAIIACVVHALAQSQIAIGELLRLADIVRRYLSRPDNRELFEAAIRDEGRLWLVLFRQPVSDELVGRHSAHLIRADDPKGTQRFYNVFSGLGSGNTLAFVIDLNGALAGLRAS